MATQRNLANSSKLPYWLFCQISWPYHEQKPLKMLPLIRTNAKPVEVGGPGASMPGLLLQGMADGAQHAHAVPLMHSSLQYRHFLQARRGQDKPARPADLWNSISCYSTCGMNPTPISSTREQATGDSAGRYAEQQV